MRLDGFETGISDQLKMIISDFRKTFVKGKPKTVFYCCYNSFDYIGPQEVPGTSHSNIPRMSPKDPT